MIHTVLHKLLEHRDHEHLRTDPYFVFSDEIIDVLICSQAALDSISTLVEYKICHLPYPRMTLQFQSRHNGERTLSEWYWICSVEEQSEENTFEVHPYCYSPRRDTVGVEGSLCRATLEKTRADWTISNAHINDPDGQVCAHASMIAVRLAVLMTHISGLDRRIVEPPPELNRKRERNGKTQIQPYSYVHVGKVYDHEGKEHHRNGTGRHMPIHMRAGHVRMQACGPGLSERKAIWIPPVIVNYRGGDAPVLQKRIVE